MSDEKRPSVDVGNRAKTVENLEGEALPLAPQEQATWDAIKEALGEADFKTLPESMVIRFIRGYATEKEPTKRSIEVLKECLAWRKQHKVDELVPEKLPKWDLYRKMWPAGLYGQDKHGRQVYIERFGAVNPTEFFKNFTTEEMQLYHVAMLERLSRKKEQRREAAGKMMYKHVVIADLDGFGSSHFGGKFTGPLKAQIHIDGYYYPESLYKMVIVNAPWYFKMAWGVAKPWIHPLTTARIKMGNDYLKEFIDEDQIPDFLGGKCKYKLGEHPDELSLDKKPEPKKEEAKAPQEKKEDGSEKKEGGAAPAKPDESEKKEATN